MLAHILSEGNTNYNRLSFDENKPEYDQVHVFNSMAFLTRD